MDKGITDMPGLTVIWGGALLKKKLPEETEHSADVELATVMESEFAPRFPVSGV